MNELVVIALRKPYTFVVLSILIVILGFQSVRNAATDIFPSIRIPVTSVVWAYDGMLPQDIEGRITYMFERFLTSTVEGIKYIHSHSYFGSSIINIFLQEHGVDPAQAEADITAIAQTVVNFLPPDIAPPMIMKLAPSSVPVATLQVTSDELTPGELYNLSIMRIRPLLVTVEGAILPHPYGGQDMQIGIMIDREKLLARHLTPEEVHEAVNRQNLVLPGGDMKIYSYDWVVLTNSSVLKVEDYENIPIKREGNNYIYLRDVADVNLMGRVIKNPVLVEGKQAVMIVVMKSSEASTLEVVEGVKEMIPRIEKVVPESVKLKVVNDASGFVEHSIEEVVHEILIAAALVGLIVLLLLGSWRPTAIIITTIPLSILCSLIALHASEETINVMTLGGLALAVGVLVDNATVVIENIDTHIHMGKPLETAILDGSRQILLPTFVATLAIAIVWFPLFGLTGVSGFLFGPMAKAIIFAMIASFFLSYTLLPTMAKYILHDPNAPSDHPHPDHPEIDRSAQKTYDLTEREAEEEALHNSDIGGTHFAVPVPEGEYGEKHEAKKPSFFSRFQQGFERGFNRFRDGYGGVLERAVDRRGLVVIVMLAMALLSGVLYYFNGRNFFPEIKSDIMQMHMRAPLGTRIEVSSRIASLVEHDIRRLLPGQVVDVINNCGLPVGPHNLAFIPTPTIGSQDCDITITLKNKESPVWDYRETLRKGLKELYPGTDFTFQASDLTAKILNFGSPAPIDVQINGPDPVDNFVFARKLRGRLSKIPGARDVVIQQTMNTPTLLVESDRPFGLGVDINQKNFGHNMLVATAGSYQIDLNFWLDRATGMTYPINVRIPQSELKTVDQLLTMPIQSNEGGEGSSNKLQLLGNVGTVTPIGTPGVVTHADIMPLFDIYVSPEGRDLGAVLADVRQVIHEMEDQVPHSAVVEIHGQASLMEDAYVEMIIGLIAAIALIYLLIVVNFQSWIDPFIIITALPGALAGIAWMLFLTHTNISVPALTGAVMTMGTATANSILVVAYARERIEMHGEALRAAIEAGIARFRPVLMTAAAMIFGMLPMSLGNSQNAPLGRAVMGGLIVATIFTLIFVPCVYAIIYNRRQKRTVAQPESSS
ncbi:Acriflavin resistance protein [Nitrosococcus oceani ATCC 19707]|uniref:Acriflavin resistance protein n=2 Tax=Nitrosococcus oceani TaxID=1229 RepID=Q3JBL9_NITOC|nr:efflux RND transporter permease subunit [Nitrosococcus oceani]ABA57777.1 Acriflavin resistance protein [Nitrosococcus oceani ATCC 19707]EDZ67601.1 RND transporter, HAE1/HME family, permease protein [Nitrosococcus oceani AFC27]KFI19794.1 RND transporter [Nitrosococcus oceani C-27]GEM19432.1 RND transporter [Nitrosococcus oceani]